MATLREGRIGLADTIGRVVIDLGNGHAVELHWQDVDRLAQAMRAQARRAEEAERIKNGSLVRDQAVLMRAGVPLALTGNRAVLAEARKEAQFNRQLRAAIPSIRSTAEVGQPRLIQHAPPSEGAPKKED